jgi:predicted DNA binding CopG/RHH family protein
MTNVVDAVIAEYANEPTPEAPEPEKPQEPEPEAKPEPEAEKPETEDGEQEDAATDDKDSEPFPKKAKNAITRLKQSNARKNAEIKHLQQKIAEYQRAKEAPAPKEEDFSTWTEFQDAKTEHRMNLRLAETQAQDIQSRVQNIEAEEEMARINEVNEIGAVFEREHPAAAKLIADNMQLIASLPPHVKKAIQLTDNPPLALHNLLSEGKLQALAELPYERAVMEIGKADSKPIPPKPQTKAPTPMTPARANVNPGFNWQAMSADDLLKTIRKG